MVVICSYQDIRKHQVKKSCDVLSPYKRRHFSSFLGLGVVFFLLDRGISFRVFFLIRCMNRLAWVSLGFIINILAKAGMHSVWNGNTFIKMYIYN